MHAELVAWVTGEGSPNQTGSRWQVYGTDLGILWDDGQGGILAAFGDTFGANRAVSGGGGDDWRTNVVARSTNRDLSEGMQLDRFLTDRPDHARQVIPRDHRLTEFTLIPTAGVSVDERNYLGYMSINRWGEPGRWWTNYAGIAYSDDGGHTWVKPDDCRWWNTPEGSQRWQMLALVRAEGYVWVFGTPHGRAGACYLARVPEHAVLDLAQHEQWTGSGWTRNQWDAAPVIPDPVSELSVMFHRHSGHWLASYYHERLNAIVVHRAPHPTGPWGPPAVAVAAAQWPGLYGAFWHPWTSDDPSPCFAMSQWGPYNVALIRLRMSDHPGAGS